MPRLTLLRLLTSAVVSSCLLSCSADSGLPGGETDGEDSQDSGQGGSDVTGDDIRDDGGGVVPDTGGRTDVEDGLSGPDDVGFQPDGAALLGVGDLCLDDLECSSSLCFRFDPNVPDGFCSAFCVDDSSCPADGFSCIFLVNSGGDFARVCVPDDLCIDRDGDRYGYGPACIGQDCDDANELVAPGFDETCDAIDNDCDGIVDENAVGAGDECDTSFIGECARGRNICADGLLECIPDRVAQAEFCDNEDNDCDGLVDEGADGEPLSEVCYAGQPATRGVGVCTAGLRTCNTGLLTDCVGQVLPTPELCNGLDDDCDGIIDENASGAGIGCTTGLPGVCATGVTACVDGDVVCEPSVTVGARAELCNGLDDDCDGTLDDGFAGVGTPCQTGDGICRRPGVVVCAADPTSEPVCDAEAGSPAAAEACDYADDDCDGTIDEGFRQPDGRYVSVTDCGACGIDCNLRWPGGPALYNVTPTCSAGGSTAACGFECLTGWVDADGIADNGCELQPEPDTVYVASPTNGGADEAGCGTWDNPCGSIGGGLNVAGIRAAARLRVSTGLYRENVTLVNGVSILGGHSALNWQRNPEIFVSTIRGQDSGTGADRVTVTASSIISPTEFSGFTVVGINARAGGNSIGILIVDSNQNLLVADNDVSAGSGGNGAAGAAGTPGQIGATGASGVTNVQQACNAGRLDGGGGGSRTCGGTNASGGRGGHSTRPQASLTGVNISGEPNGAGQSGSGTGAGAGGYGGRSEMGVSDSQGTTCYDGGDPGDAGVGAVGGPGTDGRGGSGATDAAGTVDGSLLWRPAAGVGGGSASPGAGGGGGGVGPGVEHNTISVIGSTPFATETGTCTFAPSGGGGGSGGCEGGPGGAGQGGAGSFSIYVAFSGAGPSGSTAMPVLSNNTLLRGAGGRGGDGGIGGGGGEGGPGGSGGSRTSGSTFSFCVIAGGPGGAGGRGGHGGGGGGGAGGISFDVYIHNSNGHDPGYLSANTFVLNDGVNTAGAGGSGGNSSNTTIGPGTAGVAGLFGRIRAVP